ncbi:MAG: T9SS type A sorting domain-containing protein [Bacteroidia bacterium]|nr:T9SS type A sorting domain-containing protein [Bacteroidia bacterium]
MKKLVFILTLAFFASFILPAQSNATSVININYSSPSCLTCSDGSFTVNLSGGCGARIMYAPNLTVTVQYFTGFTYIVNNACPGTYLLLFMGNEECSKDSVLFYTLPFNPTNIFVNSLEQNALSIFPNPFNNELNLQMQNDSKEIEVKIKDVCGKQLKEFTFTQSSEVNTNDLPSGVYFIEIRNSKDETYRTKLIKQ